MMKSSSWGILFLAVACSSNSPATVDAISGSAACSAEAMAVCELRSACTDGYNISRNFPDLATCESRTAEQCAVNLGASGTAQSPSHVDACAAAYPSETCTAYFDGDPVAACVPPAGSGSNGAPCGVSAQCESTFCAIAQGETCGTCQPLPAAGALCQVEADCGRDLACAVPNGSASGTCAEWVGSGSACLTGVAPCAAGLACVGDDVASSTMGTCQADGSAVDDACDGSRKTMPSCNSDDGLACIPTAAGSAVGTCQMAQLAAAGSACGDVGARPITGVIECAAGGECIKAGSATTGVCAAAAADGGACNSDPTIGPPCLGPAKCVPTGSGTAGTCTLPNAALCN